MLDFAHVHQAGTGEGVRSAPRCQQRLNTLRAADVCPADVAHIETRTINDEAAVKPLSMVYR